ncbi:MAG: ornithine cyclodeaminase family protein [Thermoleophilia bacterium]
MELLVLGDADVEGLLSIEECIPVMEEALSALARGQSHMPLRSVVAPEQAAGLMGLMPAYLAGRAPAYGIKVISVFPGNRDLGIDSHQGAVLLMSPDTGENLALVNASALTGIRTAAVSALATRLLAREEAGDLALVGAGVQAVYHLDAMAAVRRLRRVRVASRTGESARRFAEQHGGRFPFAIEAVESAEEAVRGADLVVVATTATSPVVRGAWLAAGAHVNVIGGPGAHEVDDDAMARSALFLDDRTAAEHESGEYRSAVASGAIGSEHVRGAIGEVLAGLRPGRTSAEEVTLFKSLGIAVEDVAAAAYVYARAKERGVGTWAKR